MPSFDAVRQELFLKPFKPETAPPGENINQQMMIRGVVALEYIAAQLGMIRDLMQLQAPTNTGPKL